MLGVEISGGYTKADFEAAKAEFEALLAEHDRINALVKVDQMSLGDTEVGAFIADARFALHNMRKLRHVAVVGHSKLQALLIKADNAILGKPEEELVEKYFDVADIEQAWAFVRS